MSLVREHDDRVELDDSMNALNFFYGQLGAGNLSASEQSIGSLDYAFFVDTFDALLARSA